MSTKDIVFNTVTFSLPVQPFRITAFVSIEERLPAVTEFVLRLLHTCGSVSFTSFRAYFGFSEAETLSVIESLDRQGYITMQGGELALSQQMLQKFESSPDDFPWLSKLKKRTDFVFFDLLAFSRLRRTEQGTTSANLIKLNPDSTTIASSVELARKAYRENFGQMERETSRFRGEERERTYGVHSIESIEARRPGFIPLTVSLSVTSSNLITVKLPEEFESHAKQELITEFRERVAHTLEESKPYVSSEISEYIELFELDFLRPYLLGNEVDFHKLASDIETGLAAPAGITPIFGATYSEHNLARIAERLAKAQGGRKGEAKHVGSVAWFPPDYALWGRGQDFRSSVDVLRKLIRKNGSGEDIFVFDRAQEKQEALVRNKYSATGLIELHLYRPFVTRASKLSNSLEMMLLPGGFAVIVIHAPISSEAGVLVPFGVITNNVKHLQLIHRLMNDSASGNNYAGKWSPSRDSEKVKASRFEDQCSFLHYSDI